jgi:hypothetical protein
MKYAVEMGSVGVIYIPSFIKIGSVIQKLLERIRIIIIIIIILLLLLLFILTANGFIPGGSDTTIRHNRQITHVT